MKKLPIHFLHILTLCAVIGISMLAFGMGGTSIAYANSSKTIVNPSKLILSSSSCQDQEDFAQSDGLGHSYHPVELQDPTPDCGHIAWFMPTSVTVGKTCNFTMSFFGGSTFTIDFVGTNNHHLFETAEADPSTWTISDVHEIDTAFDSSLSGDTVNVGPITIRNCRSGCNDPAITQCGQSIPNAGVTVSSHPCKNGKATCVSSHAPTTAISSSVVLPIFTSDDPNTGCNDTLIRSTRDPSTHSFFYQLTIGNAPVPCADTVTWDFSSKNIAGMTCRFGLSPLQQALPLTFIGSNGNQIDSLTTTPGVILEKTEKNVQKVQMDFYHTSVNSSYMLGGMWFDSCH